MSEEFKIFLKKLHFSVFAGIPEQIPLQKIKLKIFLIQNIFLKRIFKQIEKKEARQNDTCKIILTTIFLGEPKKISF